MSAKETIIIVYPISFAKQAESRNFDIWYFIIYEYNEKV